MTTLLWRHDEQVDVMLKPPDVNDVLLGVPSARTLRATSFTVQARQYAVSSTALGASYTDTASSQGTRPAIACCNLIS